jgi:hypothetical protein
MVAAMENSASFARGSLATAWPIRRRRADEVDRLTEQVDRRRTVIDSILSLAEQLKQGTIEKVLAKSDLELGLEFLLSKRRPHR